MNISATQSLLPSGFFDLLPPDARQQRHLYQHVLDTLASYGYQEVAPPLMEFETSLLTDKTTLLTPQTFRLMDPLSREMMGIRTDMTMQVARIANARLGDQPRPLRLCYAGTCLRVTGEGMRRERQFMQAGAELIGSNQLAADVEIIRVAVACLQPLGLGEITVDITLPELSAAILAELPAELREACRLAIDQKDKSALQGFSHPLAETLTQLMEVTGCEKPEAVDWQGIVRLLPDSLQALLTAWISRIQAIKAANIPARLTFDPLEQQRFEYHNGLAFSLFASRVESEIGRGGRYLLNDETPATGFTIYLNPLRHVMEAPAETMRCYVAYGEDAALAETMRAEGWVTLHALAPEANPLQQAKLQGCTHLLQGGKLTACE
jgi:ATP phosphoribosyltransferase regulatory subunit